MIVLALDTATPHLALGLLEVQDGRTVTALEHTERVERGHAEVILERVAALFERARLAARADRVVIGTGPGSYTGVRVGASLALGLARGWGAEVVGVPTLEAIAAGAEDGLVAVTLDARRGSVYSAAYRVAGGQVLETVAGIEKRTLEAFRELIPPKSTWLEDGTASGTTMAKMGLERAHLLLEVRYL